MGRNGIPGTPGRIGPNGIKGTQGPPGPIVSERFVYKYRKNECF